MRLSLENEYDECMRLAKKALAEGKLIVYPTDTVYGLGANALDEKAVEKIFELKKREEKPISVLVANLKQAKEFFKISKKQAEFLEKILPGPYTVLLKKKKEFSRRISATEKVGVRVPDHMFARVLAKELGFPITSTSANLSGEKSASEAGEVSRKIEEWAEVLVDGGQTKQGMESTVIDLTGKKPVVLRKGAGFDEIKELLEAD